MNVVKRTGVLEAVSFDKCLNRVSSISNGLKVNWYEVAQQMIMQIYDGVPSYKLDELAAEICASKITIHPDYGRLASRIIISNHHKNTSPSYSEVVQKLWEAGHINKQLYDMVIANREKINNVIDYTKDYQYDYFGFKTLERSYLMKVDGRIVERPQHALMRVALSIHKDDIKEAIKCYKMMSDMYFTHATPTLFNMGTNREQAASCFLVNMSDDSIDGIFKTLSDCAKISKFAGGIGVSIHKIRARDSYIRGTNGKSDGIVPMLKVFNETARYVNQCFADGTLVIANGSYKAVETVQVGDQLLNADGTYHQVLSVARKSLAPTDLYRIKTDISAEGILVTGEHEILVQDLENSRDYYIPVSKLDPNRHLVGFPCINTHLTKLTKLAETDSPRSIGIYCANHSLFTPEYLDMIGTSVNTLFKETIIASADNIFYIICEEDLNDDKYGYKIKTLDNGYESLTSTTLHFKQWSNFLAHLLYGSADSTILGEQWSINHPDDIKEFLIGLLDWDITTSSKMEIHARDVLPFNLVNLVKYVCLSVGILLSETVIDGHSVFRIVKYRHKTWCDKGANVIHWLTIRSIEREKYTGDVYDFNMEVGHKAPQEARECKAFLDQPGRWVLQGLLVQQV